MKAGGPKLCGSPALSGLLALLMRWADLVRSLNISLRAARELGDASEVARACHELGTLHLAAENPAAAERALNEARETRARLGDSRGLAATDRNLQVLCRHLRQLVRDGKLVGRGGTLRNLRRFRAVLAVGVAMLLAGGVASAVVGGENGVDGKNSVEQPAPCENSTDDPGCAVGPKAPPTTTDDDKSNPVQPPSADGGDNDSDGSVGLDDPGCESITDEDEPDPAPTACVDGGGNDGDVVVDPGDPGGASPTDGGDVVVDPGDPGGASPTDGGDTDPTEILR